MTAADTSPTPLEADSTRPRWLTAAGPVAVVVAISSVLGAGIFSGAFAALAGFADPGAGVRWGLPVVTVLTEIAAAVTFGALVLSATVLPPRDPARRGLDAAATASIAWVALAVLQFVLRYAIISGSAPTDATFGDQLMTFAWDISLGRSYLLVVGLASLTSVLAFAVRGATGALWTAVAAAGALAVQANTGHAAGAASHELAISSMFLHLAGAALWIGGLATIAVVRLRGELAQDGKRSAFAAVVARYSSIALWCYLAVAASGMVNASIRMADLGDLGTDYGVLVIAKIMLMVVLGAVGYLHRNRVVALLGDAQAHVGRLFWRLAVVELAIMGAVSGVAVALGSTAPPVPDTPFEDPTAAELVTGHPLPVEPTFWRWFTEWRWDLLFGFLCVAGLVTYVRWVRRLAKRGDQWPVGRTISWCSGMVIMFWVTSGGPAQYGHVLFSAHMIQHMIMAMVAPILLALGAPITLLVRAVPVRHDGSRGPREWVLAIVTSRWGRFFANPIVAAANFAGSMIIFYFTPVFGWALTTYIGHVAMVVHFTVAGYMFVNVLVGVDPGPQRPPYPQRLLLLFATMAFHAFFGVTLTSMETLLVPEWFGLLGRPWGPSALVDQRYGGEIAWGIGELPTLALAVVVAVMWTRSDEREARRRDRRADRDGDGELEEYNAMLAAMAERDERLRGPSGR